MNLLSLRQWRELGSAEQFVTYSRYSLLLATAPVMLVIPGVVLFRAGQNSILLAVLAVLVVAGVTTWAISTRPEFNVCPQPRAHMASTAVIATQACALVAPAAAIVLLDLASHTQAMLAVIVVAGCLSAAVVPWPLTMPWWLVALVCGITAGWAAEIAGESRVIGIYVVMLAAATPVTAWTIRLFREVERARATEAQLQVAEERLRFAQELHDTMGQHLAAISLKAELARALVARDDARADHELAELQKLAKLSTAEMHDVVTGYRTINLATEVAGMKSLLADANIALIVHGDVFEVPEEHWELAGWFVREATTNVVKHSQATSVELELAAGGVVISNDGVGGYTGPLRGLDALRRRAAAHGASVQIVREGEHFTVRLSLKEAAA